MMRWIKKNLLSGVMVIGLLVGIGLLVYPSIANYWNQFHQSQAIMTYREAVDQLSPEECDRLLESAREYNERLAERGLHFVLNEADKAAYDKELNIDGSGIMGYISIPKFHVRAPIYHGTDEVVLQKAIGHLEATSLPVGGENTHVQISGHRGLPSARLFTDIDKLKTGDLFFLFVLNKMLAYEVDQIKVVEPDCLDELQVEEGKDYVTLFTCTPYSVNTHRLLVRGQRTNYSPKEIVTETPIDKCKNYWPFITIIALLILGIAFAIRKGTKKQRGG